MKDQINIMLNRACAQGLEQGVFPGVSAAVSVRGKTGWSRALFSGGWTRSDGHREAVRRDTLFDLASLTKPLCTTLCTLYLIDQGQLTLDTSCRSVLDADMPGDKQGITIEHLLAHCAGLPAYRPYFQAFQPTAARKNRQLLLDLLLREPLEHTPGTTRVYSDLGFILLAAIIEQQGGVLLEKVFEGVVAEPLHLSADLRFLPLESAERRAGRSVAATEHCPWRQKIIQGEVHDEHCWLMGGVSGHAGLFGTAEAVVRLCEHILDAWQGRDSHLGMANALMQRALSFEKQTTLQRLGFDTPTPGRSSSGSSFSPRSAGHLGFSGTSFWIDPDQEVIMVLLTNRTHPARTNEKIKLFRPLFHDCLMKPIRDRCR
ncbi:serine hydrolase domain-containing protein [Desulfobulbus alkaliphilus]|uniref:serine hydrolase domain-containing protein n=1 Tax=Desulfobulbus alkaliphilus TaxID=869814 RepID=UPI001966B859|nr:serine hydrolase domain-containing protein [Desulfobulbus alkaliphilus]MBM9536759.1 beta-lactamase family protein [Desulfobulbus alkaliphilus]